MLSHVGFEISSSVSACDYTKPLNQYKFMEDRLRIKYMYMFHETHDVVFIKLSFKISSINLLVYQLVLTTIC